MLKQLSRGIATALVLAGLIAIGANAQSVTKKGATPGGATTQIQFNDAGVLAGDSSLTFNKTWNTLRVNNGFIETYAGPQTGTGLSDNFDYGSAALRIMADMGWYYGMYFYGTGDTYWGPSIEMPKSRSTDGTTHAIVQDGDQLGVWRTYGDDGTAFRQAGQLSIQVDGTPGASDMPGRFEVYTSSDGTTSDTKRLTIDSTGKATFTGDVELAGTLKRTSSTWIDSGGVRFGAAMLAKWSQAFSDPNDAIDTGLGRNAAGVLEINNGSAGTYRDLRLRTLIGSAGTAGAPTYTFTGETDTGIYSTTFDEFDFSVNGTRSHRFGSSLTQLVSDTANLVFGTSDGDAGLARNAAGLLEVNNGTRGTYRDILVRQAQTTAVTVATLQTCNAGNKGARAFVTDANATTFLSTVAGGGANNVPVVCDGTNWVIG